MILSEVFKHDWLVVVYDTTTRSTLQIVNNKDELEKFYLDHVGDIWIGYNSRSYDQYILKSILLGFNPKTMNDWIITEKRGGWEFSDLIHKIPLINYDVMTSLHGLKQLEGFMGHSIKETSVRFDIDRKLTDQEIQEVILYCRHDVEETIQVFMNRPQEFNSHLELLKAFKLPLKFLNKTKAQLSAIILKARKRTHKDEFDLTLVDTIQLDKYKFIMDWYKDKSNLDYSKKLKVKVAGVDHIFAWGGLHGAIENYVGEGIFLNVDVASYYPSLMIEYNFTSRNIPDPKNYTDIYNTRLALKAAKNPMQQPFKIVLNSTYGAMKDQYNNLYDPLMANNVCINGQLLLLDLIEKVEPIAKVIQTNTDGVLFKLEKIEDLEKVKSICKSWEVRSKMGLEYDLYSKVIQKDVNNYIIVDQEGHYKSKGAYVKKLNQLDYDLPIVNEAIINYLLKKIPVETTINNCDSLYKFQKITKISNKYDAAYHGTTEINERVLRVFASRKRSAPGIFKVKSRGGTFEKVANTPERSFIYNEDVRSASVPRELNKSWYIDVANKRITDILGGV